MTTIQWRYVSECGQPTAHGKYLVARTDSDEVEQLERHEQKGRLVWVEFEWLVDDDRIYAWAPNPGLPSREPPRRVIFGPIVAHPASGSHPPGMAASRYFIDRLRKP